MIRQICNVFRYETFKNIVIVFSKYYGKKREKIKIKTNVEGIVNECKELIENFFKKKIENSLNYYLIDSDLKYIDVNDFEEEGEEDVKDAQEAWQTKIEILKWMNRLIYLNCKDIPVKNINYKRILYLWFK